MSNADRQDSFEFVHEIEIDASPDLVFRFFTDPALLERWFCVHAESDPQPGGRFTFDVTGEDVMRGTFLELEPGRRLVFTSLFDNTQPRVQTTVEVTFTPVGRGTRVRLRHSGFAAAKTRDGYRRGWEHYLPRLATAVRGDDPGPDSWRKSAEEESA